MRIRTDGKFGHREDELRWAKNHWGRNKTTSVMACIEFTRAMHENLERAVEHEDMTPELAELLSTPHVNVRYEIDADVEVD